MSLSKAYTAGIVAFMVTMVAALLAHQYLLMSIVPVGLLLWAGLHKPEWLFFCLLASIPLSAELQLTPSLGTDFPDESLMWLLTPVMFLLLLQQREKVRTWLDSSIGLLLLLSLGWTLITVFFSDARWLSLKFLLAKIWYILPFTVGSIFFLGDERSLRRAAHWILVPLTITVLYVNYWHARWGFSFVGVNYITWPFYRNHVNYGALLVCLIPVAWAVSRHNGKAGTYMKGLTLLLLIALFFTYSRGAWLALAAGMLTVWFIKKRVVHIVFLVSTLMLFSAGYWLLSDNQYLRYRPTYERTIYHGDFNDHLVATYALRDLSTIERFYRWIAASRMIGERWFTGFGPNTFYPKYQQYTVAEYRTYVSDNPEHSTVHNYFLLLLTEQGVIGILLFYLLFLVMLWKAQQLYHTGTTAFLKGMGLLIGAVVAMIGVLNLLSDLIETDKVGSIFYLCAGILIALDRKNQEALRPSHPAHRAADCPAD